MEGTLEGRKGRREKQGKEERLYSHPVLKKNL